MWLFIPLLLLGMGGLFLPAASDMNEYYVTPTPGPNPDCPAGKPCHTLYEYARDNSSFFGNQANASLIFLSGVHNLNRSLDIMEMNQLILTGEANLENPEIIVDCEECSIYFNGIQEVNLEGLSLSFTARPLYDDSFKMYNVNYYMQINTVMNLMQTNVWFRNVSNIAIFKSLDTDGVMYVLSEIPNIKTEVYIKDCSFIDLDIAISHAVQGDVNINLKESSFVSQSRSLGRGKIMVFTVPIGPGEPGHIALHVTHCHINTENGIIVTTWFYPWNDSYIEVYIEDTKIETIKTAVQLNNLGSLFLNPNNVVVIIKRCEILQSTEALSIDVGGSKVQFTVQDSLIEYASSNGIYISYSNMVDFTVQGTTIAHCGTGLHLQGGYTDLESTMTLKIEDSEIVYNSHGLSIQQQTRQGDVDTSIANCSNCEMILELQVKSGQRFTKKVQDHEIIDSSNRTSVVNEQVSWNTEINIAKCTISNNQESGIEFPKTDITKHASTNGNMRMKVLDSTIAENGGSGVYINVPTNTSFEYTIENSVIANTSGISLEAYGDSDFNNKQNLTLNLRNVSFLNNRDNSSTELTTIKVAGIGNTVLVHDCLFQGNLGTPIKMLLGELYFSGMTKFSDNEGLQGGALALVFSKVYFTNNTKVVLENNTALDMGGGIYVQYVEEFDSCFYQLPYLSDANDVDTQLTFKNNKAGTSGDNLYGVILRSDCSVTADVEGLTITSNSVYNKIFRFMNSNQSSLSRASMRACLHSLSIEPVCDSLLQYILILILLIYLCYLISRCIQWKRNRNSRGQPVIRERDQSYLRNKGYRETLQYSTKEARQYNKD